jgi:hypothetical protein
LDEEKLPVYLIEWIQTHSFTAINELLTNSFETGSSKYIKIRKALLDDTDWQKDDFKDCAKLQNTIQWFLDQEVDVIYKSKRFKLLNDFIMSLPNDTPYLLQYTEKFDEDNPMFQFVANQSSIFLDKKYLNDLNDFVKSALTAIFNARKIYFKDGESVRAYFALQEFQEIIIEKSCNDGNIDKKEWENPTYQKWAEVVHLTVYLSSNNFDISVKMMLDNEELLSQSSKSQSYFKKDHEIIIQSLDHSPKNVLKLLEQYQEAMNISQEFIRLQSMFLNDSMNVPEDKRDMVQKAIDADKPLLVDKYGFSQMEDEELEKLYKNKDKALKEQEEEKEPEISPVYGYIGELLYLEYLKKTTKKIHLCCRN